MGYFSLEGNPNPPNNYPNKATEMQVLLPIETGSIISGETMQKLQKMATARGLTFEELTARALQAVADSEPVELRPMPVEPQPEGQR